MKRYVIAALAVVGLAACVTAPVPANAPATVTSTCVPFRAGSSFVAVGTTNTRGRWVQVRVGNGYDVYGWVPTEDSYCGPAELNMVWESGW